MNNCIKKVLLIGNGAMSQHIALQCTLFGNEAIMYVRNSKKIDTVKENVKKIADSLIADKLISEKKAEEALSRLEYTSDIKEACEGVDLVSESVSEDVEVKIETWKKFAPYLPKEAILTTNTSSLLPSMFADASGAPERFLSWHFHLTVFKQNLVDIMVHERTDLKYVEILKEFTESIGQNYCFLKKECAGFLANNLLFVVLDKALDLYLFGAADFVDIDKAWMTVRLENSGPFAIMDKIGLDVIIDLLPKSDNRQAKIDLLQTMIDNNKLGMKTGEGFYKYPNAVWQREDFVNRPKPIL